MEPDTEETKAGLREFLGTLPLMDLQAILGKTTARLVNKTVPKEIIDEIVKWSDAVSTLDKKAAKKQYLVNYLKMKRVPASMNHTKGELARMVLGVWKGAFGARTPEEVRSLRFLEPPIRDPFQNRVYESSNVPSDSSGSSGPNPNRPDQKKATVQKSIPEFMARAKEREMKEPKPKPLVEQSILQGASSNSQHGQGSASDNSMALAIPFRTDQHFPLLTRGSACSSNSIVSKSDAETNTELCPPAAKTATIETQTDVTIPVEYEESIVIRRDRAAQGRNIACSFATWYYERLNSVTDFHGNHFWKYCSLRMEHIYSRVLEGSQVKEVVNDGNRCCTELLNFRISNNVFFNPHLSDAGFRGVISPHGMAQVLCVGTVHTKDCGGNPGVFEQVYGLVRDPSFFNSYKIKFSLLRVRSAEHMASSICVPTPYDTSLDGIIDDNDVDEDTQ